ncbi:MAG: hypothetical protein LQ350_004654 [Teloschistes chrysophthalmus]|nr:MAG: hypothetical protein LQ350_004654 [Niorma chrysophthalma]
MAPRRGGGGGGGGGSSSGLDDTVWGQGVKLPGTHFHSPYPTAQIVFEGIAIVGIVAIMIWAAMFKKPHQPFRKIFRCNFAIHFSTDIIYENETRVQQVFFLIDLILYQSGYISEIALLGVLYLLLPHCSGHPDREGKPRLWRGLQIGHAIFLAILSILWAAAFALKIKYQVDFVTGDYYDYESVLEPFLKLDTTYSILYFFATLEVAAWAVVGFVNKERRSEHGQNLTTLLAAISLPLSIRSLYSMADVIYEELHHHTSTPKLNLATNIVYILTSLPIYAGIVAICLDLVRKQGPVMPYQDPNVAYWGGDQMGGKEGAPPPVYSQGGYPQQPMPYQQMHPQQQQMAYQQPHQQYGNPQQQYQRPFENPACHPYQHQHAPSPPQSSPPLHQHQHQPTMPQQHQAPAPASPPLPYQHAPSSPPPLHQQQQNRPPPSEMGASGVALGGGPGVGELPGPGHEHSGMGYAR